MLTQNTTLQNVKVNDSGLLRASCISSTWTLVFQNPASHHLRGLLWGRVPSSCADHFRVPGPSPLLAGGTYHPELILSRPGLQPRHRNLEALWRTRRPACSPDMCTFRRQEREALRRAHSSWLAPYFSTVSHTCSSVISKRSSRLSWPGVIS